MLAAPDQPSAELFAKISGGVHQLVDDRGGDQKWGIHAYRAMREAGFVDLSMTSFSESWQGGSAAIGLHSANTVQVRAELVAKGLAAEAEVETFLNLLDDPELAVSSYPLFSTSGRRPN
ncbi:hypothetical protein GCM10009765_36890 [Fodinicola feengrottensis]|uniref:Uncharacterized protein n=1 Tax=Fodinicola feengrottensis TaxID=435914 RepID=A0ABN2HA44_9ACTN